VRTSVALAAVSLASLLAACGDRENDSPLDAGTPTVLGSGYRIHEISDPSAPTHAANLAIVNVTGVVVVFVDNFDETKNGKSRGAVYVQDVGSQAPYSGMELYQPSYVPQDLRVAPGDVLDLNGQYQENKNIGSAVFPAGEVLPEIGKPTSTFRYEYKAPDPLVISPADLHDYNKSRRWMAMLVTVQNVTLGADLTDDGKGRVTAPLQQGGVVSNELYDLKVGTFTAGTKLKSITGIVTYFCVGSPCDLHVAPRSADDIVQ
jgi:hypothetical protein